jgi:hypothetical protein
MATRTCRICGRVDPPGRYLSHGRCQQCAIYWRRYGVERPLHRPPRPVRPPRPCETCGQPVQVLYRGRCNACYLYRYRHNRERPPELWERREG